MTSFIGYFIVVLVITAISFAVGYVIGWRNAFEYSEHIDNLDDEGIDRG